MLQLPEGQASCRSPAVGTIGWLDPQSLTGQEQDGHVTVAPSADMYAFGLLCAQLLARDRHVFLPDLPQLEVEEQVTLEDGTLLPAGKPFFKYLVFARAHPRLVFDSILQQLGPLLLSTASSPQAACLATLAIECTCPVVAQRPSAERACKRLQQVFAGAWRCVSGLAHKRGCGFGAAPKPAQQPLSGQQPSEVQGEAAEGQSAQEAAAAEAAEVLGVLCDPWVCSPSCSDPLHPLQASHRALGLCHSPSSSRQGSDAGRAVSLVQQPANTIGAASNSDQCSQGSGSIADELDCSPRPMLTGTPHAPLCLQD